MTSTNGLKKPSDSTSALTPWIERLITKEDPLHVHKTLGVLVLCSYIWRLLQYGPTDMGFKTYPHLTIPTILLHLLLNLSAFEFKIPMRRITGGYRIWPEYRWHSLVFLCRALASMLVTWYEQEFHPNEKPNYFYNYLIAIGSIMAADAGSWYFDQKHKSSSPSVRNLAAPNYVRYFFSAMQFYATSGTMVGVRRMSIPFIFVIIIQGNAFLMTLQRKNLAPKHVLVGIYGGALIVGGMVGRYELEVFGVETRYIAATIGSIAILWRLSPLPPALAFLKPLQSKYLIWTVLYFLLQRLRPLVDGDEADAIISRQQLFYVHKTLVMAMVALGWYNCKYGYNNSANNAKTVVQQPDAKKD